MAMKLYEKHESNFKNKVGNQYASLAIYAYTYSNKAMSNTFANYLKKVKWDAEERKWVYTKQDGTPAPANTDKIVIFYSSPAYLTIVNNNASGLTLKLSEGTLRADALAKDGQNAPLLGPLGMVDSLAAKRLEGGVVADK